jgi:hypothetical protein
MALGTPAQNGNTLGSEQQAEKKSYDYNAGLYSEQVNNGKAYAGVYATGPLEENAPNPTDGQTTGVVELKDEDAKTIGMPSIADANLPDAPTTESPAIIVGSAVGYETRTVNSDGSISYSFVDGVTERDTVYDEFKRSEVSEQKPGQGTAHKKITGYDGTYVIVRLDVSKYFEGEDDSEKPTYLHVKQKDNNTLLTATGMVNVADGLQVTGPTIDNGTSQPTALLEGNTFTGIPQTNGATTATDQTNTAITYTLQWEDEDAKSNKIIRTGAYTKKQLTDETDNKQYLDVLVFATANNVAGADVGKEGQLTGDVPVSMYVDQVADYNPDYKYDPTSADPFLTANVLGKFYDAAKAAKQTVEGTIVKVSKYIVKGSDLALETMVEKSDENNEETTYWSLAKSFEKPYYDQDIDRNPNDSGSGRTVSLMSEVAVTDELSLTGNGANDVRKRTLDVNSFDVQVATNTGQEAVNKVGFNLKNAWLTIADFSNTTGSEFAIGNNSTCTVDEGGRLIIDETSQLEIEWDGATKTPKEGEQAPAPDILNNGFLDLKKGGTVVNNGVITIEGTEGKPYQPGQEQQASSAEKGSEK